MASKEELIATIVEMEWKMFQSVPNIGGKASCQEDLKTFGIMRSSQAKSWSAEALESYLDDLREAEQDGRNLCTEKYARMMKSTSPLEYAALEHRIPPLDPEAPPLIEKIVAIALEWEEELKRKHPYLVQRGRPLYSSSDTPFVTSFETYLRGELSTFSLRTLQLYLENAVRQKAEKINGCGITLEHTVKRYGFVSLQEANERIKIQISKSKD